MLKILPFLVVPEINQTRNTHPRVKLLTKLPLRQTLLTYMPVIRALGNYTIDQRHPIEKPYIFGYDFQTSSSSDVSEDDTDGKTTSTKYRCIDD
ncbi:hypothetical protein NQ317_009408 [Molorchus minor]|uniref:Uncharacterized protein n=1 Tax=Molorchus minor TaxID=1323400 RepID=A0ABQ9JQY1_9CUCU|nr:hypothetical protein NQ317_009408 [Molorchus minor]